MIKKFILIIALVSIYCNVTIAKDLVVTRDVGGIFEDLFYPDGAKYEIGYTYSSIAPVNTLFPVGIYGEWAGEWADGWVAISAEIAANISRQAYTMPKNENATYDPLFYSMLGLGVNFNVFSINFNAGIVDYKYATTTKTDSYVIIKKSHKVAAILQPSIHIHIPVDDFEHFISLKVGYNICPAMRDFNGLNIGVGFGGWY